MRKCVRAEVDTNETKEKAAVWQETAAFRRSTSETFFLSLSLRKNTATCTRNCTGFFFSLSCPSVPSMCAWNMRSEPTDVVLHLLGDGMDGRSQATTERGRNKTAAGRRERSNRGAVDGMKRKKEQSGAQEAAEGKKMKGIKGV